MPNIQFFFKDKSPVLRNRITLRHFIQYLFKRENVNLNSLSYIFCSDDYLLKINQEFLKHDYYTDVITFNLSDTANLVEGEIYISLDRVRDNAKKEAVSFTEELHRVVFHGALHLCGYRDKTKHDKETMKSTENKYLKLYLK